MTINPLSARAGRPPVVAAIRRRKWRNRAAVAFFLAPSAIPLLLFTAGPMLSSLWISLHSWDLISPMRWVGLANYTHLLGDGDTRAAFWHTVYFIVGYLPLVYVGGLALALALNRRMRGRSILRSVYFLPVVTSWVMVSLTWKWILSPDGGLLNRALAAVGLPSPDWWASPTWALPSVILASAWKDLGFVMVIMLAGLQAIPQELYEAATIDGAGAWQRFRRITLPLLSPSTYFVVLISLINGFQVFDQVFVMTGGGPAGSSRPVVEEVYDLSFRYGQVGTGSALSWLLFVVIMVVTVVMTRIQRRWVTHA
ncbi:carbohydrate ABC transporter permease [Streptomyces sp. NPDC002573]|uniref:carbohydrate ABC transporter permease n=1 Tax=Streptomyces sp. NPDC002573 TaxID=3364651 RepID=UPI0036C8B2C5